VTFQVVCKTKKGEQVLEFEDHELDAIWDRLIKRYCEPITPDELMRFERIRKKYEKR
jgi:hypothetical protein